MKGNAKISYFGTDGIRGRVGGEVINSQFMLRLGLALGNVFADERKGLRVVLGKDTRVSGYMLESALQSGLVSSGADVLAMGVAPTPCIIGVNLEQPKDTLVGRLSSRDADLNRDGVAAHHVV